MKQTSTSKLEHPKQMTITRKLVFSENISSFRANHLLLPGRYFSRKRSGKGDKLHVGTKVEVKNYERKVLTVFLTQLEKLDPEVIVGHDITDFYLDILLQRLAHHNLPHWSKLCRPQIMNAVPIFKRKNKTTTTSGRFLADLMMSAPEPIRFKEYKRVDHRYSQDQRLPGVECRGYAEFL
jgi:DNA polymerase elongation subunit (family B)